MMTRWLLLTKPGMILGNLLITIAAFFLASKEFINYPLLFATTTGLALIIASACVLNNYIDRFIDRKMSRTKNRALAIGSISNQSALLLAIFLGITGNLLLIFYTNRLAAFVANAAFVEYVFIYSFLKSRTIYSTAIGSIAGAAPPIVGYCCASNHFDAAALILFVTMALWQMPHFLAIGIYRIDDYRAAQIPIFPVMKGVLRTKNHMLFYIILFIASSISLFLFNYSGLVYLIMTLLSGLLWLGFCIKGLIHNESDNIWSRQMFILSIIVFVLMCLSIVFERCSCF